MKWISTKERLPDIDKRVLVFAPMYNIDGSDFISASYLTFGNKWFLTSGFCCSQDQYFGTNQVTHWMPLPPSPGKEHCVAPCQLCQARHKSNHEVKK